MKGVYDATKRRQDVGDRYRLTRSAFDVISVFGCLRARALPGPVLVAVLAEHGYSSSSVRNQVIRLVNRGLLSSERHGRVSVYRLGETILGDFMDIAGQGRFPEYLGRLWALAYSIPETDRHQRDRLQYTARTAGYRQLRPGLMIGFNDHSAQLRSLLPAIATPAWWELITLVPENSAAARRMAARAFDLESAFLDLPRLEAQMAELSDGGKTPGAGRPDLPISKFFDLYFEIARAVMAHPILPVELVGNDQPAQRYRVLMDRCNLEYFLRFDQDVSELAGGSSSFELIEWIPEL